MRVVVICPAVRGAMSYHLHAMARHYPTPEQMTIFAPHQFDGEPLPCAVVKYPLSRSPMGKLAAYFSPLWARRRFLELLALTPDVVHLFNSDGYPSSWFWARWTRRELQKPFIVSVHDPEPHPGTLVGAFTHQMGKRTWRQASHIHIFSECFMPLMRQFGIERQRLFVIPLCTDVSNFTQYAQPTIEREPLALFFGRLEAYKGIPVLVEAAEQLRGKMRFAIAGPGKLPKRLQRRIESQPDLFELHNRFLSEAEVAHLFQRASVCVMPYVQATQSSVPWIAAAFGVPVVATATGGLADQVRQMNGVLVPPNAPQALAQGIMEAYGQMVTMPPEWNPQIVAEGYWLMYQRVYTEGCCQ
ncbi:MAG: glycosyl transferase [Fimbriimonadales bacterium]|nr:MAG: glycosyl transferase [Fimbriimonadales bacterium]